MWHLHYNYHICNSQSTTTLQLVLQLMYGFNTHSHAMCVHFHYLLDMKFSTCLQLISTIIPICTISCVTRLPLCKYYNSIFVTNVQLLYYWYSITLQLTISCWHTYISNHKISWRVKVYFWIETKGNVCIPLNIQ
jgi:hypothetical protein